MKVLTLVAALSIASPCFATTIVIPGTSDLWLAGQPAGARASGFTVGSLGVDVAPAQSPVSVSLNVGQTYEFFASGCVSNGDLSLWPCLGPDGGFLVSHFAGAENGIANVTLPLDSLIGLWAGSSAPFLVGSHLLFVASAPTLYLGTMDGWEWSNNSGAFIIEWREDRRVDPNPVPEPSTLGIIALGLLWIRRRT